MKDWLTLEGEDLDLAESEVVLLLPLVLDVDELAGVAGARVTEEHGAGLREKSLEEQQALDGFSSTFNLCTSVRGYFVQFSNSLI